MIKLLYTLFIGLLLAATIGVGISAFYEAPKQPEYPVAERTAPSLTGEPTPADLNRQREFDRQYQAYQERSEDYNRNVALLAVGFSLLILIVSLVALKSVPLIADGLLLGGVFTLIYGIGRSFGSGEQKFMFVIVAFGLLVAVALGFIKLIKPETAARKK